MPKLKGHKGLAKRAKITAGGKVKFAKPGKNHINSHMSGGMLRDKRRKMTVKQSDLKTLEKQAHRRLTAG